MASSNPKNRKPKKSPAEPAEPQETYSGPVSFARVFLRHLRQYMTTGLLVWVPFFVTIWVSWWVLESVGLSINNVIGWFFEQLHQLGNRFSVLGFLSNIRYSPWIGFLIAVLLFLTTGFLTRFIVARRAIAFGESLLARIPIIRNLYAAVQQIRDVFINREGAVFQEVVLLEYPRPGVVAIGFVTAREQGIVQAYSGRELVAVFVPTTPNPTSGFLLYLSPDELTPMDVTIEEAMKMIVSGGAYIPQHAIELVQAGEIEPGATLRDTSARGSG